MFNIGRDVSGVPSYSTEFPDLWQNYTMELALGVAQNVVVPDRGKVYRAVFGYTPGSEVWVAKNTTAAAPSGAASESLSQLNPVIRNVRYGDTLSFITPDSVARVSVTFEMVK